MKKIQMQEQIQLTAHQKKLVFNTFHNTMEALEEYIEKVGYYSDFKNKKQIFKESINNPNRTSAELADDFLAQLFCLKGIVSKKPEFFRKEVQEEYYKWINAVGIDVNNCPEELKRYLFEINEILEGRGEKIVEQTRELINDGEENNPKDVLEVFKAFQVPINKNREQGKSLEGKTHRDIEIESRFGGNAEQGQEAFGRIAGTVSNYDDFHFFPQQPASPDIARQYELAKAKLRGEVPLESWETWEGLRQWVAELERSQQQAYQQQPPYSWR